MNTLLQRKLNQLKLRKQQQTEDSRKTWTLGGWISCN